MDEYERGYYDALTMLKKYLSTLEVKEISNEYNGFLGKELKMIDDEINRLEKLKVKEVDFEKEVNDYGYHYDYVSLADRKELVAFAKHFFEIGMEVSNKQQNVWHNANEKLPTGVIVVSNCGNLHIGWSTDEGDGIEDEHGCLITKTYQKWAREKDLI